MMSCSACRLGTTREIRVEECLTDRTDERHSAERVVVRDTVYCDVAVAVHDTLREITTVTVQIGVAGDTVMRSVVSDRFRGRGVVVERDVWEKVFLGLQRDSVEVRRDSVVDVVEVERGEMVVRSEVGRKWMGSFGGWILGLVMGMVFCVGIVKMVCWLVFRRR